MHLETKLLYYLGRVPVYVLQSNKNLEPLNSNEISIAIRQAKKLEKSKFRGIKKNKSSWQEYLSKKIYPQNWKRRILAWLMLVRHKTFTVYKK